MEYRLDGLDDNVEAPDSYNRNNIASLTPRTKVWAGIKGQATSFLYRGKYAVEGTVPPVKSNDAVIFLNLPLVGHGKFEL